jgi:hypothetical protein
MVDAAGFFANPDASMTLKTRNRLIVLFILAFPFVVLFGFLISQVVGSLPSAQPLPNPNGYDDLVKAGKMVVINATVNTTFYEEMSEAQLQAVLSANADTLTLARNGLSNQCRVPSQYTETALSNHISDLGSLKSLAQAFGAEGTLAEMENRPNDAAKSYLDIIHLGNESARGGVLIDELVGIAIEATGTSHLTNLVERLDAKSCRESAESLENLDSQKQTLNQFIQQDNWSRRTFTGIRYEIVRFMTRKSLTPAQAATARKFKQQQMRTRQLIIALAARAYELDKGKPPASLADLTPDYLNTIPQDPFTGTNMVYSPQ